ncbi:MAG TPA: PorV/PorQ family protein [Bacteroidota bacterium]
MHKRRAQFLTGGLVLLVIAAMLPGTAFAQSKVGTTAAQFLGISVGGRAIAMGSAYVADNQDVTSLYWNPGAVSQTNKTEFAFVNTEWLVGTKFRWMGLLFNPDGENAVGVSLTMLDYGEEDVNTVANPEGTGQRWSAKDIAVGLSYSRRLTDKFSIGGSAKYINQSIWNESASTFTFDAGLLFVTDFNGMRIGMSMSNFGGDLTLSGRDLLNRVDIDPNNSGSNKTLVGSLKTDPWPMPLLFRVGVAMDIVKNDEITTTVAVDALRPNDNSESVNIGAEIGWRNMLFLRGGYKSLFAKEPAFSKDTQQDGLTLGAGLRYRLEGIAFIEVNYAYMQFGLFGNLNTIAVAIGL